MQQSPGAWDSMKLHDAARAGDLSEVKALLKDRPDLVFSKEMVGGTPLHCAAQNGHKDVAELLLKTRSGRCVSSALTFTRSPARAASWRFMLATLRSSLLHYNSAPVSATSMIDGNPTITLHCLIGGAKGLMSLHGPGFASTPPLRAPHISRYRGGYSGAVLVDVAYLPPTKK